MSRDSCDIPPTCLPSRDDEQTSKTAPVFVTDDPVVELVNWYRSRHNSPKVTRIPDLDEGAENWAKQLSQQGDGLNHSIDNKYGEILYWVGDNLTNTRVAMHAIREWYAESKNYDFQDPLKNFANTSHFRALIWRASKSVGIGVARGESGTYVCFRFDPPCNTSDREEIKKNVMPLMKDVPA